MSLTEKLMMADAKKASEPEERTFKSRQLAKLIGAKDPVEVKIREVSPERLTDFMAMMIDQNGNVNVGRSFDGNAMVCTDAIVDPDVKDPDLAKHFGCTTPVELVKKLFKFEVSEIAGIVMEMAGLGSDAEDEVKNL